MTVRELYLRTLGLMFEKSSSKDYTNYYMNNINQLLAETFEANNTLRLSSGKESLTEMPVVQADTDVLTYEPLMVNEVLPTGLAAKFFVDDDLSKYSIFNTRFQNQLFEIQKAVVGDIEDYYA